jgi:hypothetical protein
MTPSMVAIEGIKAMIIASILMETITIQIAALSKRLSFRNGSTLQKWAQLHVPTLVYGTEPSTLNSRSIKTLYPDVLRDILISSWAAPRCVVTKLVLAMDFRKNAEENVEKCSQIL